MSSKLSIKTKINFSFDINYLIKLGDGRICFSYENNILILNKRTFQIEIKKEKAHKKEILSLSQLEDGKLISCANEPILNIYNIEEKSLSIHQKIDVLSKIPDNLKKKFKYIFKATELTNKDLAICGTFPFMIFYEYNSLKELYEFKYYILNERGDNIKNFIQIDENQIILIAWKSYAFGSNTRILLCDLKKKKINEKPIITHKGKFNGESICKLSENYLAVAVYDSILIIDLKKLKRIKEYCVDQVFCENLCVFDNYLFCGNSIGTIYKYIINEDKLELKDKITEKDIPIVSLIKYNRETLIVSQGKTIIIYNLS